MSSVTRDSRAVTAFTNAFAEMPWMTDAEMERHYDALAGQYSSVCGEPVVANTESGARFAEALGGFFSRSSWDVTPPIPLFSLRSLGDFRSYLDGGKNCPGGSPAQRAPAVVAKLDGIKKDVANTWVIAGSDWKSLMSDLGLKGYVGSQTLFNRLTGTIGKLQKAIRSGNYQDGDIDAIEQLLAIFKDPARARLGYLILASLGGLGAAPAGHEDLCAVLAQLIDDGSTPDEGSGGQSGSPAAGGGEQSASGKRTIVGLAPVAETGRRFGFPTGPFNFWYAPQLGVWNFMPEEMLFVNPLTYGIWGMNYSAFGTRFI